MLVNSCLTVYHEENDPATKMNRWIRFNYGTEKEPKIWWHGGKGVSTNKGLENANDVKIRLPYDINLDLDIKNFKAGDILIQGDLDIDITSIRDLSNYEMYTITSITNNTFGNNKHIHLEGK